MKRAPWVKWFAADFLNGISELEPNEIAVYVVVLNRIFDEGAAIADEPIKIAKRCNMRPTSCEKAIQSLVEKGKLVRSGGRLKNRRAEKELKSRQEVSKKSAKSAQERWGKSDKTGEKPNGKPNKNSISTMRTQCDGNATADANALLLELEPEAEREEPPSPPNGGGGEVEFGLAWQAYPAAGRATIGQQPARKAWIGALETITPEALLAAVQAYAASDYARGGGKPRRFDRWLASGAFAAFAVPAMRRPAWCGPVDVRAAVAASKGDAWAATWLDRCAWRDIPRSIVTTSPTTADRLGKEVGGLLEAMGVAIVLEEAA